MRIDGEEGLRASLVDVRKAYRLIYLYQRRVFDIVKLISDEFDHVFYRWIADSFDYPVKEKKDPTEHWAWDMLPAYDFSLLYIPPEAATPAPNSWMLDLRFTADSGFPQDPKLEPDPSRFLAPQDSETTVALVGFACTKLGPKMRDWYNDVWDPYDWPEGERVDYPKDGVKIVAHRLPFAALTDKAAVERAVRDFKSLCRDHFGAAFQV